MEAEAKLVLPSGRLEPLTVVACQYAGQVALLTKGQPVTPLANCWPPCLPPVYLWNWLYWGVELAQGPQGVLRHATTLRAGKVAEREVDNKLHRLTTQRLGSFSHR